jgi:hypothetical protein
MLDPNNPLATYVGHPKVRGLTADGKKVVAWAGTLPLASDGGRRQEAAVCSAFTHMGLETQDFDATMTLQEFNHVMAGNGPPRYDYHTGFYYDFGQSPNGDPSGIKICSDDSLLVAKRSRP